MKQIILIALISIIFSCKSNKTSLDQNSISKRKISLKDIKEKKKQLLNLIITTIQLQVISYIII